MLFLSKAKADLPQAMFVAIVTVQA